MIKDRNCLLRASIIVVSYNGMLENTAPCLESIFKETNYCDYEVIVVDNNSTDGTQGYLRQLAARHHNIKFVLNKSNRGFAGGTNDGIHVSSGNYLVLLNNDTAVTKGWLERLLKPLNEDRAIGMVGPVSNEVGNEQRIFVRGTTPEVIMEEGYAWTNMSSGDIFETDRLGFFCVAMRGELTETVGLLDEKFSLGYFEDDDYCIRVKNAGYRLVCCEDVFIYHRGSKSFAKRENPTHTLMKKNKKLLEKKFHIKYSPPHPRDRHLELIGSYIERIKKEGLAPGLMYKIDNRLRLLEGMKPRGLLKKLRFERRLNHLNNLLRQYTRCEGRHHNE